MVGKAGACTCRLWCLTDMSVCVSGVAVIEYCFYNGSGREELAGKDLGDSTPYAVTVWQDTLFWSQLSSRGRVAGSIFSRELDGTVATLYENDSLNPYDIVHAFTNRTFPGEQQMWLCPVGFASVMSCAANCLQRAIHARTVGRRPVGRSVWCSRLQRGCACVSLESWRWKAEPGVAPVSWCARNLCMYLRVGGGMEGTVYMLSDVSPPFADLRDVLLVGHRDQIRVLVLERGRPQAKATLDFQLPTEAANVTAIAYDSEVGVVWSEDHSQERGIGVIKVAQVNPTGITVRRILSVAASSVSVYCTLAQKLVFWVDTVLGVIGVVDVQRKNPYVIFDQGLNSPRALVLYKRER